MGRINGKIKLTGAAEKRNNICRKLIGPAGSNLQRLRRQGPAGIYVSIRNSQEPDQRRPDYSKCDQIYIEGRNKTDVRAMAQIIKRELSAIMKGKDTRPMQAISIHPSCLPSLPSPRALIQRFGVRGGTIKFDRRTQRFTIHAMNQRDLDQLVFKFQGLESDIKRHLKQQQRQHRQHKHRDNIAQRTGSRFACMAEDDDDENRAARSRQARQARQAQLEQQERRYSEPIRKKRAQLRHKQQLLAEKLQAKKKALLEKRDADLQRQLLKFKHTQSKNTMDGSQTAYKADERKRWGIRKELFKKLDPETGANIYKPYGFTDHKTGKRIHLTGARCVPWKDVYAEMDKRHRETRAKNRQDKKLYKRHQNQVQRQRQLEELETASESSFPPLSETTTTDSSSQISMSSWTSNNTTRLDMVKTAPSTDSEKAYRAKSRHPKEKVQPKYQDEDEDDEFLGDFDLDLDDDEEEEGLSDMEFDLDDDDQFDYQENSEDDY